MDLSVRQHHQMGRQAESFLLRKGRPVNIFVEHHLTLEGLNRLQCSLRADGWRLFGTPAIPTGRSATGTAGGAMLVYKSHLAVGPYALEQMQGDFDPMNGYGHDWVAMNLCLKGQRVTLIAVYRTAGIGFSGVNVHKLGQITRFVNTCPWPVWMIGDWNMEPWELKESGFLGGFKCRTVGVALPDVTFTCTQGQARLLDYVVMDTRLSETFPGLTQAPDTPWRPHVGIDFVVKGAPRQHCVRTALVLKRFEVGPTPGKRCMWHEARREAGHAELEAKGPVYDCIAGSPLINTR